MKNWAQKWYVCKSASATWKCDPTFSQIRLYVSSSCMYVYDIPIWWCLLDIILFKGWCCNERKASGGQYGHSALQLLLFIIRATFFPPDNLYFVVCCSCCLISLNFWWWLIHQLSKKYYNSTKNKQAAVFIIISIILIMCRCIVFLNLMILWDF